MKHRSDLETFWPSVVQWYAIAGATGSLEYSLAALVFLQIARNWF
jgi:hypothetical protein